ncbi:MAG TPA: DUF6265 family protein [Candidatus Acidoferrales bacterium]|nr:DUF6265 family protein [Candidatus Acidoferrales bacterium]
MTRSTIRGAVLSGTCAIFLLAGLAVDTRAQQPTGAGTTSAPPAAQAPAPAPAAKATLADFGWLVGRWQGSWGPRVAQQVWMPPKAGVMLGTFQLTEDDKTLVLEVMTLVEQADGIELRLRHFTPSLFPWEKPGPIVLRFASSDSKGAVFQNPVDGQPKREVLTRIDADTYVMRSEVVPEKGEIQVTEITYRRQSEAAPSRKKSRASNTP